MFKREKKVCLTLNPEEVRLAFMCLMEERNVMIRAGKPTEDIDVLILKLMKK